MNNNYDYHKIFERYEVIEKRLNLLESLSEVVDTNGNKIFNTNWLLENIVFPQIKI